MSELHNLFAIRACGDDKVGRKFFDDERVVSHRFQRTGQSSKESLAVMEDGTGFTVHDSWCANDLTAKNFCDALMSQANSENGNLAGKFPQDFVGYSSVARRFRSGREDDSFGR